MNQNIDFKRAAKKALLDETLQQALNQARGGFVDKRQEAIDDLPEFYEIKARAIEVKNHTLDHLDDYLIEFEKNVLASGGQVHWARDGEEANNIVMDICRQANAKKITKGKSMISEETGLNVALETAGFEVMETDLGEYIIQLANETPSHIIAPAVHKTKAQVEALFDHFHQGGLPKNRSREQLVAEARDKLRAAFLSADVGITGVNFLVADTGSTVLVTNEGNGDLTASIPNVHIAMASIDKVIPTLEDLPGFLRLLGRSATGQAFTAYTTLFTGPKRTNDVSGPEAFHVVLLDNGRSKIRNSEFKDALRCIRCGSCLNHCAVYGAIGGHAYESVYPGPIGQVMTPLLFGTKGREAMLSACTMNGHCRVACPMDIPLPGLIHKHRQNAFKAKQNSLVERLGLSFWRWAGAHQWAYRSLTSLCSSVIAMLNKVPMLQQITPLIGAWKTDKKLMQASGKTFQSQIRNRQNKGSLHEPK